MSHVRTRPKIRHLAVAASLTILAAPALLAIDSGVEGATKAKVVERYEAESTIYFASTTEDGRASGEVVAERLRFEAGAREFEGSSIDLAGREEEVQALSGLFAVDSTLSGPAVNGTATVTSKTGESASANFFGGGDGFTLQELSVGDTFSGSGEFASFDPTAVPELEDAELYFHSTYTITGVDAVNGVATADCAGQVEAVSQAQVASQSTAARISIRRSDGSSAFAGAGLLALGLVGFGATSRRRRE